MYDSPIKNKEKIDRHIMGILIMHKILFNLSYYYIMYTELIIVDLQPFSIVEDLAFQNLIKAGFLFYQLSSRKFYTNLVSAQYEKCRSQLYELLKSISYSALTTDSWSSRATDSYTTITIHFIQNGCLKEFVLETKCFGKTI